MVMAESQLLAVLFAGLLDGLVAAGVGMMLGHLELLCLLAVVLQGMPAAMMMVLTAGQVLVAAARLPLAAHLAPAAVAAMQG